MSRPLERPVDLRSDTVTQPSAKMREAMAKAEVGDDVYREDPTVRTLERETAAALGKEEALFVASGSMGNLVSVLAHCGRGDEAIVGDEAHVFYFESPSVAAFGGVQLRTVPNRAGEIDPVDVERSVRLPEGPGPRTALLLIENTHNRGGGRAISAAHTDALASVAHRHGVAVHLDGARLFNAAAALATPVAALAAAADSVGVCFSKGLGAPVGSAVAGTRSFIERARKLRRLAGGGMPQAGIIAAAALVALRDGPARLQEDHANARLLANTLAQSGEFEIDASSVMTNIVIFTLPRGSPTDPAALAAAWRDQGVLAHHIGRGRFRAVTHLDVTRADVERAAAIMVDIAAKQRKQAVLA